MPDLITPQEPQVEQNIDISKVVSDISGYFGKYEEEFLPLLFSIEFENKINQNNQFQNLSDISNLHSFLSDSHQKFYSPGYLAEAVDQEIRTDIVVIDFGMKLNEKINKYTLLKENILTSIDQDQSPEISAVKRVLITKIDTFINFIESKLPNS